MKKRDLTKLAMMGVAAAMMSSSLEANEEMVENLQVDEQMAARGNSDYQNYPRPSNRQTGKGGMQQQDNNGMDNGMDSSCGSCNGTNGMDSSCGSCNGTNGMDNGMQKKNGKKKGNGAGCSSKHGCANHGR